MPLLLILLFACGSPAPTAAPSHTPKDDPTPAPPPRAGGDAEATAIAKKVVAHAGDAEAVSRLEFSFVVVGPETDEAKEATVETVRRRHVYSPKEGTLSVTGADTTVTFTGLRDVDPTPWAKDPAEHEDEFKAIAPDTDAATAARHWAWWINDAYWLLMPGKLMDDGVQHALDGEGHLVLTYAGVGLTPGDEYNLTVDDDGKVTAWAFELESDRAGSWDWAGYETFGPLTLSTLRSSNNGAFVIKFDEVVVVP